MMKNGSRASTPDKMRTKNNAETETYQIQRDWLESKSQQVLDDYDKKIKQRAKRKKRALKFFNGWKWFLYFLWIFPAIILGIASILDKDYMSIWRSFFNDLSSLDIETWIYLTIYFIILLVFMRLSKIDNVMFRVFLNTFFTLLLGLVAGIYVAVTIDAFI